MPHHLRRYSNHSIDLQKQRKVHLSLALIFYFKSRNASGSAHMHTRARANTWWLEKNFFFIWALVIFSYVWKKPLQLSQPTFFVHGRHKIQYQ